MQSGIYEIVNIENGHRYVGQSSNIERRWKQHYFHLNRKTSHCKKLQRAWDKYGEGAFSFSVIGNCAPEKSALNFFENVALRALSPEYNICETAGTVLGIKRTPEQNAARSRLMTGRKCPPRTAEYRASISERMKGNQYGVGSTSWVGRKHSEETRKKISLVQIGRVGRPMSDEAKAKLIQRNMGNKYAQGRVLSLEARLKMGARRRGMKFGPASQEHRMKQSLALNGKPWSEARRAAQRMAA